MYYILMLMYFLHIKRVLDFHINSAVYYYNFGTVIVTFHRLHLGYNIITVNNFYLNIDSKKLILYVVPAQQNENCGIFGQ